MQAFTTFQGNFYAQNLNAGNMVAAAAMPTVRRDGRVDEADVKSAIEHYVPPTGYDAAVTALGSDHVVRLGGPRGIGKRAAGLHMIREYTDKTIVLLSPALMLVELADRPYKPGFGYLVADREDEVSSKDTDFTWRAIRDAVREAGAYLVVSTTSRAVRADAVRHFDWQRPDLRRVLRAHAGHVEIDDTVIDAVLAGLAECSMTDFVEVARRMAAGEDHHAALAGYDVASAVDVREWFERQPLRRELLAVTALAFISVATRRTFDILLLRLEEVMAQHIPASKPKTPTVDAKDVLDPVRGNLTGPDSLIGTEYISRGATTSQVPAFKKVGYRRHVIAELFARYPAPFWDGIRDWVMDIVEHDSGVPAWGLGLLAVVDFDEVEDTYLKPWSSTQWWPGQTAAAHVLWAMCFDDTTAAVALRTARRWATHGNPAQRFTAALAFGGVLGVCYPTEALRRLWQLIMQSATGVEHACVALALLFANLVDATNDAGTVVAMLRTKVERATERSIDPDRCSLIMLAVLAVLSVRDPHDRQVSVFVYLHRNPDRADNVAELWAGVLRHATYRKRALICLLTGLASLKEISDDPVTDATALGDAFARVIPVAEHQRFREHLTVVDTIVRRRTSSSDSLAEALLAALERYRTNEPEVKS
jgi:hypothetical protein